MVSGNSTVYFFPYPTLPNGELKLEVDVSSLSDAFEQTADDSFIVHDLTTKFTVVIKAGVTDEKSALKSLAGSSDDAGEFETTMDNLKSRVGLNIVAYSPSSRFRKLLTVPSETDGMMSLSELDDFQNGKAFTFDPADYRGKVLLQAVVTYKEGQDHQFLKCGQSNEIAFYFGDYETPPGSDIDFRWAKFSEESDLEPYKEHYFRLIYKPDGSPQLVLNESHEKFSILMKGRTISGKQAVIRETMNHRIASQVWQLLLSDALNSLSKISRDNDDDYDEDYLNDFLNPHQLTLVKEFLTWLNYDDNFMSSLEILTQRLSGSSSEITTRVGDFVQDKCLAAEPFESLNRQFLEN